LLVSGRLSEVLVEFIIVIATFVATVINIFINIAKSGVARWLATTGWATRTHRLIAVVICFVGPQAEILHGSAEH
jgi:hypothetical protein